MLYFSVVKGSLSWTQDVYTEQKIPWGEFRNESLVVVLPGGEGLGGMCGAHPRQDSQTQEPGKLRTARTGLSMRK